MYKDYFRLNEMPFSIAPDPRFLFMSERHREAMAHLLYGIQGEGGIVLLTGEVGTGKTTICRSLLDQLPDNIDVALILNPRMSVEELLQTICEEFHIEVTQERLKVTTHVDFEGKLKYESQKTHERPGIKTFIDALNKQLLAAHARGRRAILIVDEAQNLDPAVLEQLRLLTNLETSSRKLLQIFLIGQPELQSMLARPEMRQVTQRVIARYHLTHLNLSEVNAYIAHRLRISGASPMIFPDTLIKQVYRASGGVPRLINLICDRALLGTYAQGHQKITQPILRQAIKEVLAANPRQTPPWLIAASLIIMAIGLAILFTSQLADAKFGVKKSWFGSASTASIPAPVSTAAPTLPIAASAPLLTDESAPASPALPASTLKWPDNLSLAESEILAYQSLFNIYGISLNTKSGVNPCRQAESRGMRCYVGHGGVPDLMLLDQPVLMRLSSAEGKEYSATLTALDHQKATLNIAGVEQQVSLNVLASAWFGQFVAIWNAPPDFNGQMSLNQKGAAVTWLRHAMETVDGIPDNGSNVFDAALARRIRTFQLSDGIQPDGLVGPLTVIRLNVRSSKIGPRLVTEKKG